MKLWPYLAGIAFIDAFFTIIIRNPLHKFKGVYDNCSGLWRKRRPLSIDYDLKLLPISTESQYSKYDPLPQHLFQGYWQTQSNSSYVLVNHLTRSFTEEQGNTQNLPALGHSDCSLLSDRVPDTFQPCPSLPRQSIYHTEGSGVKNGSVHRPELCDEGFSQHQGRQRLSAAGLGG